MSKKKDIEFDDMGLVPELFDGKHQVVPIITGGDDIIEEVNLPESLPILSLRSSVRRSHPLLSVKDGRTKNRPIWRGSLWPLRHRSRYSANLRKTRNF